MYGLLLALHVTICLSLILVILLQSGKGGGLAGGAFGGTAQTVFGGRGATDFLTRATMVLGAGFFATSLMLALLSSGTRAPARSLMQEEARRAIPTAPQQGGAPGGQRQAPSQGGAPPAGGQTPPAGGGQPAPSGAPGGGR
jgi:preprotein translocase subunit SecG